MGVSLCEFESRPPHEGPAEMLVFFLLFPSIILTFTPLLIQIKSVLIKSSVEMNRLAAVLSLIFISGALYAQELPKLKPFSEKEM